MNNLGFGFDFCLIKKNTTKQLKIGFTINVKYGECILPLLYC